MTAAVGSVTVNFRVARSCANSPQWANVTSNTKFRSDEAKLRLILPPRSTGPVDRKLLNCSTQQLLNNPSRRASLPRATPAQSIGWLDDAGHHQTKSPAPALLSYQLCN